MNKEKLERYLWKGLDLVKFDVIRIIPQSHDDAVVIMRSKEHGNLPWCLEYKWNGKYFETREALELYYHKRFHKKQEEV